MASARSGGDKGGRSRPASLRPSLKLNWSMPSMLSDTAILLSALLTTRTSYSSPLSMGTKARPFSSVAFRARNPGRHSDL